MNSVHRSVGLCQDPTREITWVTLLLALVRLFLQRLLLSGFRFFVNREGELLRARCDQVCG